MEDIEFQVEKIIEQRGLRRCTSDSEWGEFVASIRECMPLAPPYEIKYLTGEEPLSTAFQQRDVRYWGDWSDETFAAPEYYFNIERVRVRPRYLKYRGRLVADEVVDASSTFEAILCELGISYEMENGAYCIFGYR